MSYQKITVHCGVGGNRTGIGDYFSKLDAAGRPASVCSYDDFGVVKELLDYRLRSGVPHIGVFRPNVYEFGENPNYDRSAESAARDYWNHYRQQLPGELCDANHRDFKPEYKQWTWLIWGNEGRRETIWENGQNGGDWWGQVAVTIAELAMAEGFRTLAFGFSAGTPDEDIWETDGMLAYLRVCDEHPDKCGIALHEGADPKNDPPPHFGPLVNQVPNITGRYKHIFDSCDAHDLRRPRIYVSECAWFYRDAPDPGLGMQHVRQAAQFYAQHPEVMGISLWSTGPSGSGGEYGGIANKVQRLIKPITDYALSGEWDGKPRWPDNVVHYQPKKAPKPSPQPEHKPQKKSAEKGHLACRVRSHDNTIEGSSTPPGLRFKAMWTLENSGSAEWSGDFTFNYVDRRLDATRTIGLAQFGDKQSYTLREISGKERVRPGELVTLTINMIAPTTPGNYATHWELRAENNRSFGGTRWMNFLISGQPVEIEHTPTPLPGETPQPGSTKAGFQPGMNIDPDAHPPYVDDLTGLYWVRFVFKISAAVDPANRSLGAAFRRYDGLIDGYVSAGITPLIILNQETVWGNAPWDHGDWQRYAGLLAEKAGQIATHYGDRVAYQIWNEGDGVGNPSAVHVLAHDFAPVLAATARAIRQHAPSATIVCGGLMSGVGNAITYLKTVRAALNGKLPVDALAYHPYGHYVKSIRFGNFSPLGDVFKAFRQNFPDLPLWITELGVAGDSEIGAEHYHDIATYMREVVHEIAENYADTVPVLIWFGWYDSMRNAGMLTRKQKRKPEVWDAYVEMRRLGRPDKDVFESPLISDSAEFVAFDSGDADLSALAAGSTFTCRWTFENAGIATWDANYQLVHIATDDNAAALTRHSQYSLADVVDALPAKPGEKIEISLKMRAPHAFGRKFVSRWEIRDPQDQTIGQLYAAISVVAPAERRRVKSADMTWIDDVNYFDGIEVVAGREFSKQWRVRNSGERQWGAGFRLVYTDGDLAMAKGIAIHRVPHVRQGDETILSLPMIAPPALNGGPTRYTSGWRMVDNHDTYFGDPLWVTIVSTPPRPQSLAARFDDSSGWYSQLDPAWSDETLGHGGQLTIGSWGCLLTCYAMMLTAYGKRVTPLELNRKLTTLPQGQGFFGQSVAFIAPTQVLRGLRQKENARCDREATIENSVWLGGDPLARIDATLDDGQVVLAQVDSDRTDMDIDQHWVILIQRTRDGSDYLMLDPLTTPENVNSQFASLMTRYGRRDVSLDSAENLRRTIKSALVYRYEG